MAKYATYCLYSKERGVIVLLLSSKRFEFRHKDWLIRFTFLPLHVSPPPPFFLIVLIFDILFPRFKSELLIQMDGLSDLKGKKKQ